MSGSNVMKGVWVSLFCIDVALQRAHEANQAEKTEETTRVPI